MSIRSFRRQLRRLTKLFCLSIALPLTGLAQTSAPASAPAPLSADAQAAVKKGIIAAKEQEWMIAIQSFQDARKIAPDAPEIYYNLGLAESKIPGRELRAIAWFGAYLAANPNAPNAAAVKDFITGLQIKNQGNLSRLIKTVQNAGIQISEDRFSKDMDLSRVAGLWAEAGDMTAAMKTVALFGDNKNNEIGYEFIAEARAKAGDIADAQKIANLIQNRNFKSEVLGVIAVAQLKAGDIAGSQQTFASARQAADHIDLPDNRSNGLCKLVRTQAKAGDITGAQKTAELLKNDAVNVDRTVCTEPIVKAQAMAGDIAGAQKTAGLIQNATWKMIAQQDIDIFGKHIPVSQANSTTAIQAPIQPTLVVIKISDWLNKLDDRNKDHDEDDDCPLNTDPFLDLASYLTTQHSDDPKKLLYALIATAKTIIKAQNTIDKMLKQQTKP